MTVSEGATRKSYIVGIAGGSASGKSTFATALRSALLLRTPECCVEVLRMDHYFQRHGGGPTFVSPSTGEERFDANHPDSADNERLVSDLDERGAAGDAPGVLIVEGLMALHVPAIRERLDLRLFIELDADERALRRLARETERSRGTSDPQGIASYYRESARVGHLRYVEPSRMHADLILRGDGDFARATRLVSAVIVSERGTGGR